MNFFPLLQHALAMGAFLAQFSCTECANEEGRAGLGDPLCGSHHCRVALAHPHKQQRLDPDHWLGSCFPGARALSSHTICRKGCNKQRWFSLEEQGERRSAAGAGQTPSSCSQHWQGFGSSMPGRHGSSMYPPMGSNSCSREQSDFKSQLNKQWAEFIPQQQGWQLRLFSPFSCSGRKPSIKRLSQHGASEQSNPFLEPLLAFPKEKLLPNGRVPGVRGESSRSPLGARPASSLERSLHISLPCAGLTACTEPDGHPAPCRGTPGMCVPAWHCRGEGPGPPALGHPGRGAPRTG